MTDHYYDPTAKNVAWCCICGTLRKNMWFGPKSGWKFTYRKVDDPYWYLMDEPPCVELKRRDRGE